ncbi:WDR19 [Scenedesmus sp. PABB004]|nr:WDR19 [Scenedesmus sp. PABB004]
MSASMVAPSMVAPAGLGPALGGASLGAGPALLAAQVAELSAGRELRARLHAALMSLARHMSPCRNIGVLQVWRPCAPPAPGADPLSAQLYADPEIFLMGDAAFAPFRLASLSAPQFGHEGMPGRVLKSGCVQVVQNIRIIPDALHPRSALGAAAAEGVGETVYVPVYDPARPHAGPVAVLEALLSARATDSMLVANFISFVGSVLAALQLSLSNPLPQPVRRSRLEGRKPRPVHPDSAADLAQAAPAPAEQAAAAAEPAAAGPAAAPCGADGEALERSSSNSPGAPDAGLPPPAGGAAQGSGSGSALSAGAAAMPPPCPAKAGRPRAPAPAGGVDAGDRPCKLRRTLSMRKLWSVGAAELGDGAVALAWSPRLPLVAAAGSKAQEVTMVAWARGAAPLLAAGTAKGNLQLFHLSERRRTPVVGKHTKRVALGVWSGDGALAMAGLDKTVTVSDQRGDTVRSFAFRGEPLELALAACKADDGAPGAAKLGGAAAPGGAALELSFQENYGGMARHVWFGDGFVMVGFKSGQVVVVSSLSTEIGEEVHCHRPLELLADMAHCEALRRVAVGGGRAVKIIDVGAAYGEAPGEGVELPPGHSVERLGWGQDGQVLSVGTSGGMLVTYLAALPSVFAAHGGRVAALTSLGEVTVVDAASRDATAVAVACEPALCALGPGHLAVGMNNQVLFYSHGAAGPVGLVSRRTYLGAVAAVHLNASHAAVLTDGRLLVHPIAPGGAAGGGGSGVQHAGDDDDGGADLCLPRGGAGAPRADPVVAAALSKHFVLTASAGGALSYHMLHGGGLALVSEFRHAGGTILSLHPQPAGPRCVLADASGLVAMYSPLSDELLPLPGFQGALAQVLWDVEDAAVLAAANAAGELWAYAFVQQSVGGQRLEPLCAASLPRGHTPVVLANGRLTVRLSSGALDASLLDSHKPLHEPGGGAKQLAKRLAACVKLNRLQEARAAAAALGTAEGWRALGGAAMQALDVQLATAAFRQVGDAAMVLSLEPLAGVEDRNLLAGSLLVLLERDYNQAQELLLRSSRPMAALEMRRDLKHWPQALALAQELAPSSVPELFKEHAATQEMLGEHAEARTHYQQALDLLSASGADPGLAAACLAGVARTTLQLGDLRAGRALTAQADSPGLWRECGAILEALRQLPEAAEMYERAGQVEKAASIHIAAKNFAAAAPLMARVASAALQLQFAKAKEAEGRWADAAAAYEAAGDVDAVVQLCLDRLGDAPRACALARRTRSTGAAAAVARHCLSAGDAALAVEFLLLAGQLDQAFDVAAAKGAMDAFARLVADGARAPEEAQRVAQYYAARGELEQAADMWARGGEPERAVGLYLQEEGNYKLAHAKLFATLQQLRGLGAPPQRELERRLALLHSYVLVRSLVSLGDHAGAARMLVRVAGSISRRARGGGAHGRRARAPAPARAGAAALLQPAAATTAPCRGRRFPKHVVPILTSTVIECARAGLRRTAFEHASTLMRPEPAVSERHRKKIELMVRKPDRGDEPPPGLAPCPFCALPGPDTELQCVGCQSELPFDIATGKRMTLADWCECPACRMPASGAGLAAILAAEGRCPMCGAEAALGDVRPVADPLAPYRAAAAPAGALMHREGAAARDGPLEQSSGAAAAAAPARWAADGPLEQQQRGGPCFSWAPFWAQQEARWRQHDLAALLCKTALLVGNVLTPSYTGDPGRVRAVRLSAAAVAAAQLATLALLVWRRPAYDAHRRLLCAAHWLACSAVVWASLPVLGHSGQRSAPARLATLLFRLGVLMPCTMALMHRLPSLHVLAFTGAFSIVIVLTWTRRFCAAALADPATSHETSALLSALAAGLDKLTGQGSALPDGTWQPTADAIAAACPAGAGAGAAPCGGVVLGQCVAVADVAAIWLGVCLPVAVVALAELTAKWAWIHTSAPGRAALRASPEVPVAFKAPSSRGFVVAQLLKLHILLDVPLVVCWLVFAGWLRRWPAHSAAALDAAAAHTEH